jgi:hypothetical protein
MRAGVEMFRELSGVGGPGSGGAILLLPFAALLVLIGGGGVLVGLGLGTGRGAARKFAMLSSIVGLVLIALSAPLALIIGIGLLFVFMSGHVISGLALIGSPLLFLVTIVVLLQKHEATSQLDKRRFFAIGALIVLSAFLPSPNLSPPADTRTDEERHAENQKYKAGIDAADRELLEDKHLWDLYFEALAPDGSMDTLDPLAYAALTKNTAALAILFAHTPARFDRSPAAFAAVRAGDERVLQLFVAQGVSLGEGGGIDEAVRRGTPATLGFLVAHGVSAQTALCVLKEINGPAAEKEKRALLVAAGAKDNACDEAAGQ